MEQKARYSAKSKLIYTKSTGHDLKIKAFDYQTTRHVHLTLIKEIISL